jgi:gamma-glutamylcyclotransferase (GGCT)/AIG2-like uncharacterized protein YtfP
MSDAPVGVFVYGTLMRGCSRHHFLSDGQFEGEASTDGRLLSLGEYPALIDGAGTVRGELYSFEDLPAALDVLDDVEDFDPANPEGTELLAWLYVYNQPRGSAPIIPGGDWRKRS